MPGFPLIGSSLRTWLPLVLAVDQRGDRLSAGDGATGIRATVEATQHNHGRIVQIAVDDVTLDGVGTTAESEIVAWSPGLGILCQQRQCCRNGIIVAVPLRVAPFPAL